MDNYVVLAAVLLKLDKNLGVKRHNLVPDLIEEDDFWRNYFYKIAQFKRDLMPAEDTTYVKETIKVKKQVQVQSNQDVELQQLVSKNLT